MYQGSRSEDNYAQSRTDEFEKVNERAIDSNNHNSDVVKERKNMNLSAAATSDKEKPEPPLGTITLGELLRLRDDLYQFMQTKESIVRRVNEDSTIFLTHESGGFGWSIKVTLTGRHTEGRNEV